MDGEAPSDKAKPAGLSLRSHHERLARDGYVPPPPKEFPMVYVGKCSGRRSLTDEQVIAARRQVATCSVTQLAKQYGVNYDTMLNALKGYSYKHLNAEHPPQL